MENKERNAAMDELFARDETAMFGTTVLARSAEMEAIRDCDRKARILDHVCMWADDFHLFHHSEYHNGFSAAITALKDRISELLKPPKPKTATQEIREFVQTWPQSVPVEALLSEIDRLEAEYAEKD